MTAQAGDLLVEQIAPRLRALVPKSVKPVGAEDTEEVAQDAIVIAAQMLHRVELSGKKFQGNRIKKRGHPERSAARAKAGRHGVEGSRESSQDHQTRPNIVPAFHGILRLRDARHLRPPGIAPPQNDPVFFDAIALEKVHARQHRLLRPVAHAEWTTALSPVK